jgi:hypothetical protein
MQKHGAGCGTDWASFRSCLEGPQTRGDPMTTPQPVHDTRPEDRATMFRPHIPHYRRVANLAAIGPAIVAYFVGREVLTRVLRAVEPAEGQRTNGKAHH